jgi:ubiquinone/menaquinone biosynthesis C-methylase UbiE
VWAIDTFAGNLPDDAAFLDFGCGCGRVAASLHDQCPQVAITGVDVDGEAVAWCQSHLPGRYLALPGAVGLPFDSATFDVVYAINVFTHLPEDLQFAWLKEIHRVLRPRGLFLVTTRTQPSGASAGFTFSPAPGRPFNEQFAFHSAEYIRTAWSPWMELLAHEPRRVGPRDFFVCRRT